VIIRTRFARGNVITRFFYIFVLLIFKILNNSIIFVEQFARFNIVFFIIFFSIIAFAFAAFVSFIIINLYIFLTVMLISVILFYKPLGLGIKCDYIILTLFYSLFIYRIYNRFFNFVYYNRVYL